MDYKCISKGGKELIRFLKSEKALFPFITALREQKKTSLYDFLICHWNETTSEAINKAFTWAETKQGSDFWFRLYEKARVAYYERLQSERMIKRMLYCQLPTS